MTSSHVLMVDDDMDICRQLGDYLGKNDFRVTAVNTGKQMLDYLAREVVDLLLLEPRLRGEDGLQITRAARESSTTPIVVLSHHDEVADRVMGLELGADDYIAKPFSAREVLARIRAVLRRCKVEFVWTRTGRHVARLSLCRLGAQCAPVPPEVTRRRPCRGLARRVQSATRISLVAPTDPDARAASSTSRA